MDNKKVVLAVTLLFLFISLNSFSQIKNKTLVNKFSVSISNGGYWRASNYGMKNLNYNIALQGEYKINKNISAVLNTGFDFEHFKENNISFDPNLNTPSSTKLVMFELTTGINYYIPIQKKANAFLTTNLGYYNERVFISSTLLKQFENVDENWSGKFGINGGLGFESGFFKNIDWTFLAKYHYLFSEDDNMKFVSINLGLKYNF
ncbi:MAG: outer membrane beta-barrel protein [Ignavibacteria bacterium]|jgi:hypothetical protein